MTVRVRFAPSPTGTLHIGGARTALFNWLFARHHGGTFLLRIEDTDQERSTREFEQSIIEGLQWLGVAGDQPPIYQTQRMELYREQVQKLLDAGKAYYCTVTTEELEAMRKQAEAEKRAFRFRGKERGQTKKPEKSSVVRIIAPDTGNVSFDDIIRGPISFSASELDDFIIARSDGFPTYNFCAAVDDATMQITHVIRGDDHINNTPKQVMVYQALGLKVPLFAHLPLIHGPDGKKMSKRHGATSVVEYQEMGYLPEAMANYLARLGWAHGDQEIFTLDELVSAFDLDAVGTSPAIFNFDKLNWVNAQHLAKRSDAELAELTLPYLHKLGLHALPDEYTVTALATERERAKTLSELAAVSAFYFRDQVEFDTASAQKWLDHKGRERLTQVQQALEELAPFTADNIAAAFKSLLEKMGCKMVELAQPVRVALTGTTVSPGIYEVLEILGKKRSIQRIERALNQ